MGLPFDLEDIVGVALADVLRRAGMIVGCIGGAAAFTGLSFGVLAMIDDLDPGALLEGIAAALPLVIVPGVTAWGILYLPLLIAIGFYFAKADAPSLKAFLVFMALAVILMVLAADDDPFRFLALPVAAGFMGAIGWLGWLLSKKREAEGEIHLAGVAIENEQRRQRMRDEQGIVVAEREFVIDEEPPA